MHTTLPLTENNISCHSATAGRSVNANAKDGYDKPHKKIIIPNVLARWPWPRRLSPFYPEVSAASTAWIAGLKAFSPKAQEAFERGDFGLCACLAYPTARKEHVRAGCDYINAVFVIDEYSDVSGEHEVRKQKDIVMDALRNPHKPRPDGEWIGGEVHRQWVFCYLIFNIKTYTTDRFWERSIPHATAQGQKRFIMAYDEYLEGVVQEAIDRDQHLVRDIQSYTEVRRRTIGVGQIFALLELGLDIPDEVWLHPAIIDMVTAAYDMSFLTNDYVSYNLEQARGDAIHNIVTIVMHEFDTDINGAMEKFLRAKADVPKWGETIDSQVMEYCEGVGNWVRGHDDWGFESGRYLGSKGLEIKRKGWMSLLPKEGPRESAVGPVLVGSLL
ncbi:hypothetical protein AZE42_08340 [Rhizopogon vesiculosus]|uniref:Terpene synthase n=1 Tax=Rhizopogon vesiculosus TaxID=180088 RepID=A0A1J8PU65_9AGAM|nr:hypothetical protein AZE42_08340 [Rhizopogon vesiculosus]